MYELKKHEMIPIKHGHVSFSIHHSSDLLEPPMYLLSISKNDISVNVHLSETEFKYMAAVMYNFSER